MPNELIASRERAAEVARALRSAERVAFDTEFIRESTFFPKVELLQVATDSSAWVLDAAALGRVGLAPIVEVFQDSRILKIAHASQADQECLFTSLGITASPILDTAMAAALSGMGESIGLAALLKETLGVHLPKGHARTNWSVRPLPSHLIEYARADVEHLVAAADKLMGGLRSAGRLAWAIELSSKWASHEIHDPSPESIAERLAVGGRLDEKSFSALLELVRWRERRVREINIPRRWMADDSVLVDLARVRPKDLDHLTSFRGLNKGEAKSRGHLILEAIRRGEANLVHRPPRRPRHAAPSPEESRAIDLLKCYLGILADRYRISPRYLLSNESLLPLLRDADALETPGEMLARGHLTEYAAGLIGQELVEFIRGRRTLRIEGATAGGRGGIRVGVADSRPLD